MFYLNKKCWSIQVVTFLKLFSHPVQSILNPMEVLQVAWALEQKHNPRQILQREQFTWFWMQICADSITVNPLIKHNTEGGNMRTDAFDLIAHFFGGSKPSAASYSSITCWRVVFYSFHNYTIYCNCMQIECSALSRVVLKTSRLQNNCNSESVEKTKLQPWCLFTQSWPKCLCSASGNVLSLTKQHLELVSEANLPRIKSWRRQEVPNPWIDERENSRPGKGHLPIHYSRFFRAEDKNKQKKWQARPNRYTIHHVRFGPQL